MFFCDRTPAGGISRAVRGQCRRFLVRFLRTYSDAPFCRVSLRRLESERRKPRDLGRESGEFGREGVAGPFHGQLGAAPYRTFALEEKSPTAVIRGFARFAAGNLAEIPGKNARSRQHFRPRGPAVRSRRCAEVPQGVPLFQGLRRSRFAPDLITGGFVPGGLPGWTAEANSREETPAKQRQ